MVIASEKLAPASGRWLRNLGLAVFAVGYVIGKLLRHSTLRDFYPWDLVTLGVSGLLGSVIVFAHRRGGFGHRARLRRLARRTGVELTGILRPFAGDPLAHTAPIATQRPRKNQPGYRALSARTFDLELDDGRRFRVEPIVAILDSPTDTVPFGTRVTLSPATADRAIYRDAEPVIRGTEERPLVIRAEQGRRAGRSLKPAHSPA